MTAIDPAALDEITHDSLCEHVYAAHTEHRPRADQHLGYVDKSKDVIEIELRRAGIGLSVQQSLSSLSSGTQSSSTGFICWQTASLFADWVLAGSVSPIRDVLTKDSVVLELGAGVSAVLASVLGPTVAHYVASDQAHVLKLMKHNFSNNAVSQRYTSSTVTREVAHIPRKSENSEAWSKVDFVALDWESPGSGMRSFIELTGRQHADVVLACDTIYNSYLIPHFLACVSSVMSMGSVAVVAMQLRDEAITEEFLEVALTKGFRAHSVKDEYLTPELIEGFAVFCLQKAA